MSKPFLSVIIPVHNESKRIPLSLIDIDRRLSKAEYSYEIIVIDGGSTDGTGEIVKNIGRIVKNLRLVECKENRGEGYAVRRGMLEAKGNYRFLADAGNSVPINWFDNSLPFLKEGYEVIADLRLPVCFSEAAAEKIFSLSRTNKSAFGLEALLLAKKLGYRIKEISVNRISRHKFTFDALRVRIWFWRDVYNIKKMNFHE